MLLAPRLWLDAAELRLEPPLLKALLLLGLGELETCRLEIWFPPPERSVDAGRLVEGRSPPLGRLAEDRSPLGLVEGRSPPLGRLAEDRSPLGLVEGRSVLGRFVDEFRSPADRFVLPPYLFAVDLFE
jgi:hypothetical protein